MIANCRPLSFRGGGCTQCRGTRSGDEFEEDFPLSSGTVISEPIVICVALLLLIHLSASVILIYLQLIYRYELQSRSVERR
jgi:hypothetical protein